MNEEKDEGCVEAWWVEEWTEVKMNEEVGQEG